MRIAVNLLPFRKQLYGAGRYAKHIVHELSLLDRKNEYYLFVTEEGKHHFPSEGRNIRTVICPFSPQSVVARIFWEQVVLPFQLGARRIDVLFTPSVAIPFYFRGGKATTVHDIAYRKVPEKYPLLRRKYVEWATETAVRRSDVVITDTEFSRKEIAREFDVAERNIVVAHCAADEIFGRRHTKIQEKAVRKKYSLPGKFMLYVGAIEPSKNIGSVLHAFAEAREKLEEDVRFVIVGGLEWGSSDLAEAIDEYRQRGIVQVLGYVEDLELAVIYSMASVFVYMSSYEGFGLPVLEAMASGTPVLSGDAEAVREFAGNTVRFADPTDKVEILNALTTFLKKSPSTGNAKRNARDRGRVFSWARSAKIVHSTLIQIAEQNHSRREQG